MKVVVTVDDRKLAVKSWGGYVEVDVVQAVCCTSSPTNRCMVHVTCGVHSFVFIISNQFGHCI